MRTPFTFASRLDLFELKSTTFNRGLATTTKEGNVFPCNLLNVTSRESATFDLFDSSEVKSTIFDLLLLESLDFPASAVS